MNGLDMSFKVASHLWKELSGWEEPLNFLKSKVERGELGLNAGRGYYDWTGRDPSEIRRVRDQLLIKRIKEVTEWKPTIEQQALKSI